MTTNTNLVPNTIRMGRRRARAMRWWAAAAAVSIVVAGMWSLRATAAAGDGGRELSRLVRERSENVEALRVQLGRVSSELASVQRELFVSGRIQSRPDWSDLLALLDQMAGPNVVIETCKVSESAPARAGRPGGAAPARVGKADASKQEPVDLGYVIQIGGAARDQAFVSEFVTAMESSGLFERITQQTRRRSLLAGDAVGFDLRAELASTVEAQP